MLSVSHLRKDFGAIRAVDGVSFEVHRGKIFGLLGPNGAGKSTTIRMILNIIQPDSGEILYDSLPFRESTRNAVGYLPEERGLYKKNKLLDTILYLARLRGMVPSLAQAEAYRWLKRFGLLQQVQRKVEALSKGNQQKVQFISAVIHNPTLVILDEPFSGLDPINQILFKDILLELKQQNRAIIFSTHQMEQAERLSDNLCLINKGKVVLGGSVKEVKKMYGRNAVHVEFDGDGKFLESLPGVQNCILYKNSAELELRPTTQPQALLAQILPSLEVRKFEILEPSLHSIFMHTVGETKVEKEVTA